MQIKQAKEVEARPFDISEWNSDVKAFFKPFNGFETLAVNEEFIAYNNLKRTREERFRAAFNIAKTALVDETGAALLTDDDYEAIKGASFEPFKRLWRYAVDPDHVDETFKKK